METTPGKRVQLLREAKGFKSLTSFAEHTSIKIGTLSALEGDKSAPSMDTLAKLLTAFPDVSMDWLINGTGEMLKGSRILTPVSALTPAIAPVAEEPATAYGCLSPDLVNALRLETVELRAENKALRDELRQARSEFRADFIAQARQYNSVKLSQEELIARLYTKLDEYELRLGYRQPTAQERELLQGGGETRMEVKPFGARYREAAEPQAATGEEPSGCSVWVMSPGHSTRLAA